MINNFSRYPDLAEAIHRRPAWPKVMCFGDSWFQYPGAKRTDLQKQLPQLFKEALFFNEGVAGRDSAMYKRGRNRVARAIADYGFDVLLLSMGGNDVVGNELSEFIKTKDAPQRIGSRNWGIVPPQVRDHIRLSAFESGLNFLRDDFVEMFQRRETANRSCEIILHTYSYIWPNGKPFKLGPFKAGPWVYPYLRDVGLPSISDQRVVTCWLLDQFAILIDELASQFPRVRVVNSLEALPLSRQWDNEIHPKAAGFKSIAKTYWKPVLQPLLA